jgi:hypothetical protein
MYIYIIEIRNKQNLSIELVNYMKKSEKDIEEPNNRQNNSSSSNSA